MTGRYRTAAAFRIALEAHMAGPRSCGSRGGSSTLSSAPDVGHIAKAGMNPLDLIKQYRSLVNHVHYKGMGSDHQWATGGAGSHP